MIWEVLRKTVRVLMVVLSIFVVQPTFPAFLYQTPPVQEMVVLPPPTGGGNPVIAFWSHLVAPEDIRAARDEGNEYVVDYRDSSLHPDCAIDVWLESGTGLARMSRTRGSPDGSVRILDGCLEVRTRLMPLGRNLVIFKVVSGTVEPGDFNARDYLAEWPPLSLERESG